ncbi:MAG TPA: hypothetical protein VK607_10460 [Kofleriaceae bacterium]|nr:hypothetical protein [Kofleriaceae bacterium]
MAEVFARDTPPEFGALELTPAGRTTKMPELERPRETTDRVHPLGDPIDTQAWMTEGQPLSDGIFAREIGRLCWTLLASSGILALALLAAAYILRRR